MFDYLADDYLSLLDLIKFYSKLLLGIVQTYKAVSSDIPQAVLKVVSHIRVSRGCNIYRAWNSE